MYRGFNSNEKSSKLGVPCDVVKSAPLFLTEINSTQIIENGNFPSVQTITGGYSNNTTPANRGTKLTNGLTTHFAAFTKPVVFKF